jgi:hypothetical protein
MFLSCVFRHIVSFDHHSGRMQPLPRKSDIFDNGTASQQIRTRLLLRTEKERLPGG